MTNEDFFYLMAPRQREIIRLAGTGLRNRQIAETLGISVRTVKNQLYSVSQILKDNYPSHTGRVRPVPSAAGMEVSDGHI